MDDDQGQQHSHSDEHSPNPDGDSPKPDFEIVTITYRDKSWNVPKDRGRWDMNVAFEYEDGNPIRALMILLGGSMENLYKTRREVNGLCKTKDELAAFEKHVAEILNKECIN